MLVGGLLIASMAVGMLVRRIVSGGRDQAPKLDTPIVSRITFNHHIAPILYEHCVGCHRPGPAASFSLANYGEVKERAEAVLKTVQDESMPPWLPDRVGGSILGERGMTPGQVALIREWVEEGSLEGEPQDLPKMVLPPAGWSGGTPSFAINVALPDSTPPNLDGETLSLPLAFRSSGRIKGIEFQVSDPRLVRLVALQVVGKPPQPPPSSSQPPFESIQPALFPEGQIPVWSPGKPTFVPTPGWELKEPSDFELRVATLPSSQASGGTITIGIYRDPDRASVLTKNIRLVARLDDESQSPVVSYELPTAASALSVFAAGPDSMQRLELRAKFPNGETTSLLAIRNWNPRWQDAYRYSAPIPLPQGTVLSLFHLEHPATNAPASSTATRAVVLPEVVLQVQVATPADLEKLP